MCRRTRVSPWMRFPFGLTMDDNVLTWIENIILRGLERYSRRLRHLTHIGERSEAHSESSACADDSWEWRVCQQHAAITQLDLTIECNNIDSRKQRNHNCYSAEADNTSALPIFNISKPFGTTNTCTDRMATTHSFKLKHQILIQKLHISVGQLTSFQYFSFLSMWCRNTVIEY